MSTRQDRVKVATAFIKLLGQAVHTPSISTEGELGRLVATNSDFFISLLLGATTTVKTARELQAVADKHVYKKEEA